MIVLFAAIGLVLLLVYDNRSFIITFFKEKIFKPKPIKLPKTKKSKDTFDEKILEEKPRDPDTEIKPENISYGSFTLPEEKQVQDKPQEQVFFGNTIFDSEFSDNEDDFDIDKMLAEIEDERRETDSKTYGSEIFDGEYLPDFSEMSIGELDTILEDSIGSDYGDYQNYLPTWEEDLSGEELAEAIKSLPRSIKILLISDIFKRKY